MKFPAVFKPTWQKIIWALILGELIFVVSVILQPNVQTLFLVLPLLVSIGLFLINTAIWFLAAYILVAIFFRIIKKA